MITTQDKLACATRELALRHAAYPGWVRNRSMTQAKADHELACQAAIVADYTRQAAEESGQQALFPQAVAR